MRQLFRRHPDLFLTSYASMEAKIWYLKRAMNIQLQKERSFPLLLHFNYSKVLWPRCEAVKRNEIKIEFELIEVLKGSDEEFCDKFGIPRETLEELKQSRQYVEEVDRLWVYNSGK